jgi:hypothetical protein
MAQIDRIKEAIAVLRIEHKECSLTCPWRSMSQEDIDEILNRISRLESAS